MASIKSTFFLGIPILLYGIDPSLSSFKKVKGFESSFFSPKTGLQYLKINYQDTSTVRPKIGFLKFGLAFLQVKDLSVLLDLRHANAKTLFDKWEELAENKAIKYATMEPIKISLVQQSGDLLLLEGSKGKLLASGQLKLWGEVVCTTDALEERFNQAVISFNNVTNELEIIKGNVNSRKIRFSFKETDAEKKLQNN